MAKKGNGTQPQTAIVTGGTRGIGRALVEGYLKEGANVVFSYLSSHELADEIIATSNAGTRLIAKQADVRDRLEVEALVGAAIDRFGRIDALVNNAHAPYKAKWFEDASWDDFQREIDILLKGPFNTIKAVLPHMKAQGGGAIVNVGSTMAQVPRPQHSFYSAAKNALIGLNQSLVMELGKYGIRLNIVTPGGLMTDHNVDYPPEVMKRLGEETPLHNRIGTCEEAADAIIMMTQDKSRFISGAIVLASGGFAVG
jgi:3-oxoacyl-[acyl-carrier protein] reductase